MKNIDYSRPIAIWTGEDRIFNEVLPSVTAIIRSGGCSWNRCLMCQYRHERIPTKSREELSSFMRDQAGALLEKVKETDNPLVKLYTSGSFFDEKEVPKEIRTEIAKIVAGRTFIVECRADYINGDDIAEFIAQMNNIHENSRLFVAIGLETSSDLIREKCIDKGITFKTYTEKTEEIHKAGGFVKTYLLHKPPFLTENEAYQDMIKTISDIRPYTDLYSLNPCAVQRNTYLEKLWKQGCYRPPYLWSVSKILSESDLHITCDPLLGGTKRGIHNCGKCDEMILDAIRDYNISGDRELMKSVMEMECDCKNEWECVMDNEKPWAMPLTF